MQKQNIYLKRYFCKLILPKKEKNMNFIIIDTSQRLIDKRVRIRRLPTTVRKKTGQIKLLCLILPNENLQKGVAKKHMKNQTN